jgi:hypothetical protein
LIKKWKIRWHSVLISLFLSYYNALAAEWDFLTVNRARTVNIWIESTSIQRREDSIFVWVIYDREEPAQDGAMSSKLLNQYDCTNRQARTWRQSYYLKSMAGGEKMPPKNKVQCEADDSLDIKLDEECVENWKPIFYRTTGAAILKAFCVGNVASGFLSQVQKY